MIYHFDDFRNVKRFSKEVLQRYSGASTAAVSELEFPEENDPRDEFLASASTEELEQALDPDRKLSALDPVPADEGTPAEEPNPYLDFDLPHGDIAKLLGHGVRPKDAVDAGLTHVTSSEGASHLNRSDTGDFEGMMIPYGLLGPGIQHCRVILNRPVRLKTSKGRLVAVLQPVASTNHLYYVPGTTQGVLDDSNVPILLCDGELSALAALQFQKDGQPFVHPVGMGGAWGWRKTTAYEDRDGGETKIEKAPVVDIEEKIARKGRRIIVAFASDTGKGPESKGARPALVKFLKRLKATVTILEVPPGPFESCHDLGQWIAAAGAPAVAEEVQKLLDSASTSTSNWSLTRGYVETEDGLFWVNSETGNRTFLASPFKVLAATRQIDGRDWGRLLEVCTPDGGVQKFIIPMSEFAAGGTSLAEVLLGLGVRVNPNNSAKDRLALWIQLQAPEAIFVTPRVGWHGKSFVLPEQTISPPGADVVVYQRSRGAAHRYYEKGTLQEWIEKIGRWCVGNSRLVFAVSLAFVGPLLRILDQESGGFHYRGLSSTGKTTALRVAGSVWGGGEKGFAQTWRATSNGLEAVAEQHNDTILCLDEIGQVSADEVGRTSYMLANGQGKVRMTKDIHVRPSMEWRQVSLSTGEISLADHMMTVGRQVRAGQEVRLLDIAADAGRGMGIFEQLHDCPSADQLANQFQSATQAYYGTPSIAFLKHLVLDRDQVEEKAKGLMEKFLQTQVQQPASGEVLRAARRFALVAVAGEYASGLGITGWPKDEALRAAITCFRSWKDRRGSLGAGDVEAAIVQVRLFLILHGGSRFETICTDDDTKVERTGARNRVGFRQEIPDEELNSGGGDPAGKSTEECEHRSYVYYVQLATFRKEVCRGFDPEMVAKALRDRGHLDINETGRLTYQKRLPGIGRQRVYCIRPSIFAE